MTKICKQFSTCPRQLYIHLRSLTSCKYRPNLNNVPVRSQTNNFNLFFSLTFSKPSDFRLPDIVMLSAHQTRNYENRSTQCPYGCDEIHPIKCTMPPITGRFYTLLNAAGFHLNGKTSPIPKNRHLNSTMAS